MIELAELIDELRSELQKARLSGEQEDLRFEMGPVELEVSLAVSREAAGKAGIKFWVAELGAEGKLSGSSTQRLKLTLQPRIGGADRAAWISGQEEQHER